ncbi:hypothetical protein PPTG_24866 [Phytophthora nicotianae INRA-310]|uniref:Uncharacterized protein n=1 Tax=Phytophthora nicotianae (strain INRA-310) TaxID=761204 RepID=W2PCE7_PHYN3|nr:hypothetical protein PPTG_24866 [Phytophthora nicotianae INRA-310]ETM97684.1 hypothetical protein PPTG_24866 [Phytophthora nicotianae INRA-310]
MALLSSCLLYGTLPIMPTYTTPLMIAKMPVELLRYFPTVPSEVCHIHQLYFVGDIRAGRTPPQAKSSKAATTPAVVEGQEDPVVKKKMATL